MTYKTYKQFTRKAWDFKVFVQC